MCQNQLVLSADTICISRCRSSSRQGFTEWGIHSYLTAADKKNSDCSHRGNDGQTVTELLKVSASTRITNKLGLSPLAEAIIAGQLANARLLLNKVCYHTLHGTWSLSF